MPSFVYQKEWKIIKKKKANKVNESLLKVGFFIRNKIIRTIGPKRINIPTEHKAIKLVSINEMLKTVPAFKDIKSITILK